RGGAGSVSAAPGPPYRRRRCSPAPAPASLRAVGPSRCRSGTWVLPLLGTLGAGRGACPSDGHLSRRQAAPGPRGVRGGSALATPVLRPGTGSPARPGSPRPPGPAADPPLPLVLAIARR